MAASVPHHGRKCPIKAAKRPAKAGSLPFLGRKVPNIEMALPFLRRKLSAQRPGRSHRGATDSAPDAKVSAPEVKGLERIVARLGREETTRSKVRPRKAADEELRPRFTFVPVSPSGPSQCRLKYWTARSRFSAANKI